MSKRNDDRCRKPRPGLLNRRESLAAGVGLVAAMSLWSVAAAEEPRMPIVRMADLEIDPAQLESFTAAVKEEMEISVRVEPGVLAIYAVAEKDNTAKLRFFEMYADEAAFKSHIESPHFQKFRAITKDMVVSRKLIEMVSVQLSDKKK
ncbi:putative quinol monooxygenase [Isosphaeraceae bacterium EP7]